MLKREKHDMWHRLFKNSDPEYIIAVLQRMLRMKQYRLDNGQVFEIPDKKEEGEQQRRGKIFLLPGEKLARYA